MLVGTLWLACHLLTLRVQTPTPCTFVIVPAIPITRSLIEIYRYFMLNTSCLQILLFLSKLLVN